MGFFFCFFVCVLSSRVAYLSKQLCLLYWFRNKKRKNVAADVFYLDQIFKFSRPLHQLKVGIEFSKMEHSSINTVQFWCKELNSVLSFSNYKRICRIWMHYSLFSLFKHSSLCCNVLGLLKAKVAGDRTFLSPESWTNRRWTECIWCQNNTVFQ